MKLKPEVKITKKNGYCLTLHDQCCQVPATEEYLIRSIEHGITYEEELVKIIMKKENMNEIVASLTLAEFLVKYQDYIAKDDTRYIIT